MRIKLKLDKDGVIEDYVWLASGEYEESDGWAVRDCDADPSYIIPYVSRIIEVKDGLYHVDNTGTKTKAGIEWDKAMAKEQAKQGEINQWKNELRDTDYVVIKISEAKALGEDTPALLTKYKDVLDRRAELRKQINEAEGTDK